MSVNQKYVEDKFETAFFALSIDGILDKAGWLGPSGQKIFDKNRRFTNVWEDASSTREGMSGVWLETDAKAAANVKNAAKALSVVLTKNKIPAAYSAASIFGSVADTRCRRNHVNGGKTAVTLRQGNNIIWAFGRPLG